MTKLKAITLQEHIKQCLVILRENPEAKDFLMVSASDEEGNGFEPVYFSPTLGIFTEDGEFYAGDEDIEIFKEFHPEVVHPKPNAICIN